MTDAMSSGSIVVCIVTIVLVMYASLQSLVYDMMMRITLRSQPLPIALSLWSAVASLPAVHPMRIPCKSSASSGSRCCSCSNSGSFTITALLEVDRPFFQLAPIGLTFMRPQASYCTMVRLLFMHSSGLSFGSCGGRSDSRKKLDQYAL